MLDRFLLLQKNAIMLASLDMEKLPRFLEIHKWKMLQSLVTLLKEIANDVTYCEKESACISEAIPGIKSLTKMLRKIIITALTCLKKSCCKIFENIFMEMIDEIEENEIYTIAILLDTRLKNKGFLNEGAADHVELLLTKLVANQMKKNDLSKRLADNFDPDRSASSYKRRKMNDAETIWSI